MAGDGEHGIGMRRRLSRRCNRCPACPGRRGGRRHHSRTHLGRLVRQRGGTSGALWGAALEELGTRPATGNRRPLSPSQRASGAQRQRSSNSAQPWATRPWSKPSFPSPTLQSEVAAGHGLAVPWTAAAAPAEHAAGGTAKLIPGRARPPPRREEPRHPRRRSDLLRPRRHHRRPRAHRAPIAAENPPGGHGMTKPLVLAVGSDDEGSTTRKL